MLISCVINHQFLLMLFRDPTFLLCEGIPSNDYLIIFSSFFCRCDQISDIKLSGVRSTIYETNKFVSLFPTIIQQAHLHKYVEAPCDLGKLQIFITPDEKEWKCLNSYVKSVKLFKPKRNKSSHPNLDYTDKTRKEQINGIKRFG